MHGRPRTCSQYTSEIHRGWSSEILGADCVIDNRAKDLMRTLSHDSSHRLGVRCPHSLVASKRSTLLPVLFDVL